MYIYICIEKNTVDVYIQNSRNISNCHHLADFCDEVPRIANILHENCTKQVRKSAPTKVVKNWCTPKLDHIYLPAHHVIFMVWVASAIIWKTATPKKTGRFQDSRSIKWDIMKTGRNCPDPSLSNLIKHSQPTSLFGWPKSVLSSKGEMERILINPTGAVSFTDGSIPPMKGWTKTTKLNYCWWQPENRWTHQLRLVVEILSFTVFF